MILSPALIHRGFFLQRGFIGGDRPLIRGGQTSNPQGDRPLIHRGQTSKLLKKIGGLSPSYPL